MRFTKAWNDRKKERRKNPVSGVFTELDEDELDLSDDEEEEDDIQFLNFQEMNSMSSGKTLVQGKRLREVRGNLVQQQRGRVGTVRQMVQGRFHFTQPWWKITILRTKGPNKVLKIQNDKFSLAYELRNDEFVIENNVVFQFLKSLDSRSDNANDAAGKFVDFVSKTLNCRDHLRFDKLKEQLDLYEEHLPEKEKGEAQFFKARLGSFDAQFVFKALKFPRLFHLLPQLLPLHFLGIIEELEEENLAALDKDLIERPWIFGFKKFLFKDHHILGCEAPYTAFELSGLVDTIEQPYKDALIIYDLLKLYSREGHTCAKVNFVKWELRDVVQQFDEAVRFLNRNKIAKVQVIEPTQWIFLHYLYQAEKKIAKFVNKMFQYQLENRWTLNVDFESEYFDNVRSDPDQYKAAQALTQLPVVVISGKGGCGKTTVVTKVMSACDLVLPSHLDPQNIEDKNINTTEECRSCIGKEMKLPEDLPRQRGIRGVENSEQDSDYIPLSSEESHYQTFYPEDLDRTEYPVIIYTAPTGKAANLLGKRATPKDEAEAGIRTPGYTLHQIIWSYRSFISDKKMEDEKPWKFKNVHTVVVDECSLVAVTTFETMISALVTEGKLHRIILLGDVRQLPSIEPGNFLADMFKVLEQYGCSFELKTNHRAESQLIVDNATRISLRQFPVFDESKKFKLHPVLQCKDNSLINEVLWKILRKEKELQKDETSQFVTFTNQTIKNINAIACKYYNEHPLEDNKKKKIFCKNDKICLKKNSMVNLYEENSHRQIKPVKKKKGSKEELPDSMEMTIKEDRAGQTLADETMSSTRKMEKEDIETTRLCNGEIFFIDQDHSEIDKKGKITRYILLNNRDPEDPRSFWVNFREVKNKCKMTHAWARTIHTFQGSESETVVYVLGTSVSWQNWQHVYTAITRGKKSVHIVGSCDILNEAVKKMEPKRYTMLDYQLHNMLPKPEEITELLHKPSTEKFTAIKPPSVHKESNNGFPVPGPSGVENHLLHSPLLPANQNVPQIRKSVSSISHNFNVSNDSQWSEVDDLDLTRAMECGETRNEAVFAFTALKNQVQTNENEDIESENTGERDLFSPWADDLSLSGIIDEYDSDEGVLKNIHKEKEIKEMCTQSISHQKPDQLIRLEQEEVIDVSSKEELGQSISDVNQSTAKQEVINDNSVEELSSSDELSQSMLNIKPSKPYKEVINDNSVEELSSGDELSQSMLNIKPSKPYKEAINDNSVEELSSEEELSQSMLNIKPSKPYKEVINDNSVEELSSGDELSQSMLNIKQSKANDEVIDDNSEELSQSMLVIKPVQTNNLDMKSPVCDDGNLSQKADLFLDTSVSYGNLTQLVNIVNGDTRDLEVMNVSGVNNTDTYRSPLPTNSPLNRSRENGGNNRKEQDLSGYISYESDTNCSPSSPIKRSIGTQNKEVTPKKPKLIFEQMVSPTRRHLSQMSMSQDD